MSTKTVLFLLLLSVLVDPEHYIAIRVRLVCLLCCGNSSQLLVLLVLGQPNFNEREFVVVVLSLKYRCMGEMAEYLLG